MSKRLQDKVVIVTGASSGLGEATALLAAKEGAKLVLAARRRDKSEEVLRRIEKEGGEGLFVQTDVSKSADCARLVAATLERFGHLDGAVNNAGIPGPQMTRVADIDESGWNETLAVNLTGVFLCMKHEIPAMLTTGKGAIVNMSSMYGLKASDVGHSPYSVSKFGVIGLTQSAAIDYGDKGLRINAVCPGFTHSEMVDPLTENPKFVPTVVRRHSAMNRIGESHEVAEAVVWLLSDAASFVNGTALEITGGPTTRLY